MPPKSKKYVSRTPSLKPLPPKVGQMKALSRASKPVVGVGQLKNIGKVGK